MGTKRKATAAVAAPEPFKVTHVVLTGSPSDDTKKKASEMFPGAMHVNHVSIVKYTDEGKW